MDHFPCCPHVEFIGSGGIGLSVVSLRTVSIRERDPESIPQVTSDPRRYAKISGIYLSELARNLLRPDTKSIRMVSAVWQNYVREAQLVILNILEWIISYVIAVFVAVVTSLMAFELVIYSADCLLGSLQCRQYLPLQMLFNMQAVAVMMILVFSTSLIPTLLWSALPEARGTRPANLRYGLFGLLTGGIGFIVFLLFINSENRAFDQGGLSRLLDLSTLLFAIPVLIGGMAAGIVLSVLRQRFLDFAKE